MKCEDCRALLSALLDGELSEHERAAVMEHLSECDECRAVFNDLSVSHELLASMGEEDVPEGFSARVMQRVHAVRMRRTLRRVSGFAACLALTLIAGGLFLSSGLDKSSAPGSMENFAAPDMVMDAEAPTANETYGATADGEGLPQSKQETADDAPGDSSPGFTATDEPEAPLQPDEPDAAQKVETVQPAETPQPMETPQPVFRLADTPAAEDFLARNALPDTLSDSGACVSVDTLRELPEDVELLTDDVLSEDVLTNWDGESTVRVELVPVTEETE